MNIVKILQIISNETRLEILKWLGNPALHFKELSFSVGEEAISEMGVCVGLLQKKSGLSQSTISQIYGAYGVCRTCNFKTAREMDPLFTQ